MSLIRDAINALKRQKNEPSALTRKTSEYEFLPGYLEIIEKPPSPWARRSAIAIVVFLLSVLAWSVWGKLDIHASAQGKVMVSSHSKLIQALEQGEVIAINVSDGQRVKKGELLIQLNPTGVNAESRRLSEQYNHLNLNKSRILALLSDEPLDSFSPPIEASKEQISISRQHLVSEFNETHQLIERLIAEESVNKAQKKANQRDINSLNRLKANIETRLSASKSLILSSYISKIELLEQEKELLEIERNISNMQAQGYVLDAQAHSLAEQRDTLIAQKRVEYYDQINQLNSQIVEIRQELIKAKERQRVQALRSPVDGVVQQLNIHTLGGVVSPAQALMVVVPQNTHLEAEVNILNKDIGFVMAGQPVEIKIDSFPFTKYGTVSGELLHVSKDAVEDERLGYVFPARIRLENDKILVDDKWVPLGAGMSLVAEIKTGSRRLIEYLLSPLQQYQSEAMRER